MELLREFGLLLADRRRAAGLSRRELAKLAKAESREPECMTIDSTPVFAVFRMRREHEDTGTGGLDDLAEALDAILLGHRNIHDYDMGKIFRIN